ncbi:MAG: type II toxin-antitoxin system RelE/ParE family toxin [Lachnospiraceae bacterium]|nr:type II toxin-antitoxin system RelE/ParE family toxin [Lachnospiraceae bacterium]
MKTYTIRITRQAREHLRGIKDYITNTLLAPEAAQNTVSVLKKEIKSLSEMPERMKLTEEEPWHSAGIRRMRVKNYYVYFWIDEANRKVQVTSIICVARDQAAQLEMMERE